MATECIRWSAYSSSVSASFYQFWQNDLFTDVTVAVPGGVVVAAHRAVLSARSAVLRRLLTPSAGGGESQQQPAPLLLLRGVSPDQLRLLLQLLYTGRVQADQSQLRELLELCRELEVEDLDAVAGSLRPLEEGSDERETGPGPALAASSSQPPAAEMGTLAAEAAAVGTATSVGETAATVPASSSVGETAAVEAAAIEVASASSLEAEAVVAAAARFGLPAGGGACWSECWLPSAPVPPSPPGGPPRPYTPVTDRVDSEDGEDETRGRTPELSPSVTTEDGGSQERGDRWPGEPVGGAGSSATFRHVSSLLESLDRRQLLQLKERADQIMYPDFTSWLPTELMVSILSRLSPRDLLVAARTCRRWQALSEDDALWRRSLRLTGVVLPPGTAGSPETVAQSRLLCLRYLGWTELPLPPPKRLKGHESVIRCMAVDGDRVVTGSSDKDKTVGIWSASSGTLTCRLRGESEVTCVQVEGDTVVTAARDCTLGVWNAVSGRRRHRLFGHEGIVWSVALQGGRAASGSDDKTARFWDVHSGRQEAVLRGHETVVRVVCFDGHWVVSGDDSGCVQVWSAERRTVDTVWQARSRHVMVLQHAHGVVVSGHGDGAINVWDMATRRLRYELRAHAGWVTDVYVSPHGLLLSGCKDGTALLWQLGSGALLHRLTGQQGHKQRVTAVRLLPGLALTSSRDGRVKLWDISSGAFIRDLVTPEVSGGPVKHVWVGPDRLICGVQNNASDRPQVLVMEMALRREDGGGIDVAAVGAEGGSGGAAR